MSLEERRQSSPPSSTTPKSTTTTATKNNTPNQFKHQQTTLDHRDEIGGEHRKLSPNTIPPSSATTDSSAPILQPKTEVMAMHNLGSNSSQYEHQLKNHQQTGSGVDSSTWHNNNNNNSTNINIESAPNTSNTDHVNESQQSSVTNNLSDNKPPVIEGSKSQAGSKANLNRHQTQQPPLQQQTQQQQQHPTQLPSQSQQYHGIFSPQFPAILQSSLESRVDQVIRTTLHNSPAYTPTSGRNSSNNTTVNNSNVLNNKQSGNMPLQTTPTSLIFNPTTSSMSTTTSTQQTTLSQPQSSAGLISGTGVTSAPSTSIYGPTLSSMGDNLSAANSNLLAKTSPSHSALAAAAALQSLNQSHVQRSQQQQLAHSQPSPYLNGPGAMSKQSTNGNGTPMPQAAHGGNIHQLSKLNGPLMAHSEQLNRPSFASEQSNAGSLNFSSRGPSNNNAVGNTDPKITGPGPLGLSNMGWQEQNHGTNMLPRLPPLHGLNDPLPPYALSSSQSPYGNMNSQLTNAHGSNNDSNMIGLDSDTLSKLNSMKSSPGQNNSMQFRDEKTFPLNIPTLAPNKQINPSSDGSRGLPPNSVNEARRNMMMFSYNLLSPLIPGVGAAKRIIPMDEEMKNAIQNGQFYLKYGHIASGILTNRMFVHHFNIIDYLRRDRFMPEEVESIERINRTLSISDLLCLMELIGHRSPNKSGPEANKLPLHLYADSGFMNANGSGLADLTLANIHNNSPHKGGAFLSSSPNRSEMLGPPGIDRSRRSSQSPSDTSRSHLGGNINHPKFTSTHSTNIHHQQPVAITSHQFTHPSNQQQLTSPQTNRSSPFQPPMSTGLNHPLTRPKSHSTILDLNMASLNPSYTPPTTQVRQPLPAHQSSSRPNLAGLDLMTAPSSSTSVPVTAHMSSKTPQTPKLQDMMPKPNTKSMPMSSPFGSDKLSSKDPMSISHADLHNASARFDIDSNSLLLMQNHGLTRHPDHLKHPQTHTYLPPTLMGPGGMQIQHELIESGVSSHLSSSQPNSGSFSSGPRDSLNRNLGSSGMVYTNIPPSGMEHRQQTNDLSARGMGLGPGSTPNGPNEAQMKQYVAAIQQQMIMSGKPGENSPNSMNVMNSMPPFMYQQGSQRPPLGEPMHIDTVQQVKQPLGPNSSPKLNNHRSIITGSGSAPPRKSKKAKPSPPVGSMEGKTATVEHLDTDAHIIEVSNSSANISSVPRLSAAEPIEQFAKNETGTNQTFQKTNDIGSSPCNASSAQLSSGDILTARETEALDAISARGQEKFENVEPLDGNSLAPVCPKPTSDLSDSTGPTCIDKTKNSLDISTETKSSEVKQPDLSSNPTTVDQPSKYQKLFTKKAWLKNYDLEDQARLNEDKPTIDDNMPVSTRACIKLEPNSDNVVDEAATNETKPSTQNSKPNGPKNGKVKSDSKKKGKEARVKKVNVKASKTPTVKSAENDSEGTNDTTSDPDDTDETDSLKSTNDKKLRRMPRRKVKLGCDRDPSDQLSVPCKAKTQKESSEKETMAARGRGKKDKNTNPSCDTAVHSKRKYNSDDESVKQKTKKIKESASKNLESIESPLTSKSKRRAGDKFLQTQPCYEIVPKSIRCLECRRVRQPSVKGDKVVQAKQVSKTNWDDFCRFFEFRKLRYNKSAQIVVAGFSEVGDAKDTDMRLWNPSDEGEVPTNINYEIAKFILANIGDEFCKLVLQERSALKSYEAEIGDKRITWKRAVNGLRELCDVCSTTLFNCHYVCDRCGFVVCIDCHGSRVGSSTEGNADEASIKRESSDSNHCEVPTETEQTAVTNKKSKKDSHGWIFCAKNEEHSQDKLTLTKIIAGNCLEEVWSLLHDIRERLDLGQCCCKSSMFLTDTEPANNDTKTGSSVNVKQELDQTTEGSHSTLKGLLLASNDSPINGQVRTKQQSVDSDNADTQRSSLACTFDGSLDNPAMDFETEDDSRQVSAAIEGCIASLAVEGSTDTSGNTDSNRTQHIETASNETSSRFCDGDLLVLSHAVHEDNLTLFREHWRHGKPVLVRGVHKRMHIKMWLPQFFLGKFGDYRSDLVDCRNGDIHRQSMRKYWDGFEPTSSKKKFKEDTIPGHIPSANNEEPSAITTSYYSGSALWRLKDWPPGQDFNEILPDHYNDFMNNLPLKPYTTRTGKLNLACRLPKEMLKPDLGPKMYSAYGTTKFPERGTTNLHLDISDAVNVMVYVGGAMPFEQGSSEYSEIYENTINDCFVDSAMKDQIRKKKLIPGALWHIFKPSDVAKIREFLNKVSDECNISIEKRIDPIHDQTWYLDQKLLDRLYSEYGVKSYAILQCMGDAILIPAGAPHQVKNLQNCIKVANDFVSPENIRYCLQLTNEFRNLPETHINQEDKLQIKNIMYHSVKDSIQYIRMFESGKVRSKDESTSEEDEICSDRHDGNLDHSTEV